MIRQLTALLLLVSLGLARAGEPPAGEPPKGGDAEKPKGPRYDWVLAFANGDRLHCRVHGLEGGVLSFSSRMAPGRRLRIASSLLLRFLSFVLTSELVRISPHSLLERG